jgi:hypothetical protein
LNQSSNKAWASNYSPAPNKTGEEQAKETEEFVKQVVMNTTIWETMEKIVLRKIGTRKKIGFDETNWALRTASNEGYNRAMNEILQLIPTTGGNK